MEPVFTGNAFVPVSIKEQHIRLLPGFSIGDFQKNFAVSLQMPCYIFTGTKAIGNIIAAGRMDVNTHPFIVMSRRIMSVDIDRLIKTTDYVFPVENSDIHAKKLTSVSQCNKKWIFP